MLKKHDNAERARDLRDGAAGSRPGPSAACLVPVPAEAGPLLGIAGTNYALRTGWLEGDLNGRWAIENEGVTPDIEVENSPAEVMAGHDPQLERAITEALKLLEQTPVRRVPRPAPAVRASERPKS